MLQDKDEQTSGHYSDKLRQHDDHTASDCFIGIQIKINSYTNFSQTRERTDPIHLLKTPHLKTIEQVPLLME